MFSGEHKAHTLGGPLAGDLLDVAHRSCLQWSR
jgi:hypothetical protein